jgi:putative protease
LSARDEDGHSTTLTAPPAEAAVNRPVTPEQLSLQLAKTGGTVYRCAQVGVQLDEGLSLPVSRINALRREALEALSAQRLIPPTRRTLPLTLPQKGKNGTEAVVYTVSCRKPEQITPALLTLRPESVALELEAFQLDFDAAAAALTAVREAGLRPAVTLPRILWDRETADCTALLQRLRPLGVDTAYVGTLAAAALARRCGFAHLRGDFGLGVYNSETLTQLKALGLDSAVLSFEQRKERIRDLDKCLPTELLVYGRFPLMVMENCIIKNRTGKCSCHKENLMIDRKKARFPVVRAYGCRNEIENSVPLFLADKPESYQSIGLWAARLRFTTESGADCAQLLARYLGQSDYAPREFTRGLYFREVE